MSYKKTIKIYPLRVIELSREIYNAQNARFGKLEWKRKGLRRSSRGRHGAGEGDNRHRPYQATLWRALIQGESLLKVMKQEENGGDDGEEDQCHAVAGPEEGRV
ncbi:MAG: hypothetical protein SPI19_05240 [Peptoniphilaceae bacterium]|nr:hypothetical protein [Peptoniphilaceae bacterium]